MLFGRRRQRRKLLATPLTDAQRRLMHEAAPLTARVPAALRARHEGAVQVLLAEKNFEGAGGLALTDEMRLAVAGQAALLQLRDDADHFPGLDSIVIYPEAFVVAHEEWDDDGLVHDAPDELSGESWRQGAVVLAWDDVRRESRDGEAYNVVLHEFAHQLDDQTGEADGTPPLRDGDLAARWTAAFQAAYDDHRRRARRRREMLFDADAAESPAEFFATAVELVFTVPGELRQEFPRVHEVLVAWLGWDPGAPAPPRSSGTGT